MLRAEQMADEQQTSDSAQGANDKASKVIKEILSSMREDENAGPLADALEGAWSAGRFDVDTVVREIESEPQEKESDERG
jgi:hypothetical protein